MNLKNQMRGDPRLLGALVAGYGTGIPIALMLSSVMDPSVFGLGLGLFLGLVVGSVTYWLRRSR